MVVVKVMIKSSQVKVNFINQLVIKMWIIIPKCLKFQ